MYSLYDGAEYAELYLESGYDLYMKMDASKFDETITFSGVGADENNFLAKKTIKESTFDWDEILGMNETDFNKAITTKSAASLKEIENSKLDTDFIALQKGVIEGEEKGIKQYFAEKQAKAKFNNTVAPAFEYENHAGGKAKLADFKGKYVYIDVWATWCGPCRAEIPSLKMVEEKYHGKNIAFLSISVDTDKDHEKWKTFVTEKQLGGVQLFADKNWNSDFIKHFEINSIPRFLLIDPSGKVVNADADRPSNPKLQKTLDALLK
jgi:thiol-disulfide isomerase/thioredoxin